MELIAIDLFCGKGGWTNALIEQGFTVYGFDIEPQPDYKGIFVQCDILAMNADDLRSYGASFATCSSPCEEFSVHGMKHFHPNPKHPEMGLRLFRHAQDILHALAIPYVMENVRPAQKFVGRSTMHCGPFHLWGTGVPAMFPKEAYKVTKGIQLAGGIKDWSVLTQEQKKTHRKTDFMISYGSKSKERAEASAQAAMIPMAVARTVAETAKRLTQEVLF